MSQFYTASPQKTVSYRSFEPLNIFKRSKLTNVIVLLISCIIFFTSLSFTLLLRTIPEPIGMRLFLPSMFTIVLLSVIGMLYGVVKLNNDKIMGSVVFLLSFLSLLSFIVQIIVFL